jgi:hypothetical protein
MTIVNGKLKNVGVLNNYLGGLINNSGNTINNYDTINNFLGAIIHNFGLYNNHPGSTINNNGDINNHFDGSINNLGTINNFCTGVFTNLGSFYGDPVVDACGVGTISATITIQPDSLNLKSQGVFTAYITSLGSYFIEDIDVTTIECEGAQVTRTSFDNGMLVAKFNVGALVGVVVGNEVEFTVIGQVSDGTSFEGADSIRVISKGK